MSVVTREEYLKELIKQKGYGNLKQFAAEIDIPYTTLLSMLNNGIGGAAVGSIIKICEALDISVESLKSELVEPSLNNAIFNLSKTILADRNLMNLLLSAKNLGEKDIEMLVYLSKRMEKSSDI
ncbi:MAG TPA: helix-turn-helix transcriptional regulator [Phascolarctobacterium faecium]|uniref:helix-turn-helix transcriptional regulator n=1 Tax=Phascolarctobacterium faecium TaxID=33025 RepID=UPI0024310147|nr:helix-turn-helix transcriptional regulator [Phascolarctobacterium faecium]HJI10890.1 helix-turn-helix transcriptional regulator [Phascolarctobacterium faecium]